MPSIYLISPLDYIEAGNRARKINDWDTLTSESTHIDVYNHFLKFLEYMKDKYYDETYVNRQGIEKIAKTKSAPILIENFILFAGLLPEEWEQLKTKKDTAGFCLLVEEAFRTQLKEGAIIGVYNNTMVSKILGLTDKKEFSGAVTMEQVTGMDIK